MTTGTPLGGPPPHRPIERILGGVVRLLSALPSPVQTALAGGKVERDGQLLEPELHLLCRLTEQAMRQRPISPAVLRKQQSAGARIGGGRPQRDGTATRELKVTGPLGPLRARLYSDAAARSRTSSPLLVYFHGGGFVFGDVDSHDAVCRLLVRHAATSVLSVEYRLAPEHPFPAPVDDAYAAFRWAQANATELGVDRARVAVGGDSAGGNLAAVVALLARLRPEEGPDPVAQLLVYPATNRQVAWRSLDLFATGFFLTRASIDWFYEQYTSEEERRPGGRDFRINPMLADDLTGAAPALVVTAGFDPLRDEGEAYAEALRAAGNVATLRRFPGLVHGFVNLVGISPVCRRATIELATTFGALLAPPPPRARPGSLS